MAKEDRVNRWPARTIAWQDTVRAASVAVLLAGTASAQPPGHGPCGEGAPFPPPLGASLFEPRVEGLPYRAEAVVEFVSGGTEANQTARRTTVVVARDAAGRTRREDAVGPEEARVVAIDDPVADVRYVFFPDREEGRKFTKRLPGPMGEGFHRPRGADGGPAVKTESLGTQVIAGVEADGTRDTITVPAGVHGNDAPIEIVTERWYSAELKTVLRRRHRDPRGERTWALTDITRGEPDASLFEVPDGVEIEEAIR